ncbi:MAG: hypothetical protein HYW47_04255 [Deltaproteobacteria bacterium]|nr:hypothetical protein [Deltaproteobacteria bacterium]
MKKKLICLSVAFVICGTSFAVTQNTHRNPFEPIHVSQKRKKSLNTLDLSSFKIRGLITNHSAVLEAQGASFIVIVGSKIGYQGAEIIAIKDDHLVLKLNYKNKDDQWFRKTWKWSI